MKMETIYVYLLNERTDVWRPVQAERISDSIFKIPDTAAIPEYEEWMFKPGDTVRCQSKDLSEGACLVAIEKWNG
jgi:hypothetical protein